LQDPETGVAFVCSAIFFVISKRYEVKRVSLLFLILAFGLILQQFPLPQSKVFSATHDPELPQILLDTTFVPPIGNTINVPAGGNLQAAINNAQPGDTLVLQAGATYLTPPDGFLLPDKPGSNWIVIRTSNLSGLPASGTRVTPTHSAAMAKIMTTAVSPAVYTAPNAHHYRFIGIEFAVAANVALNYGVIALGDGNGAQNSLAIVPHDIIIDRCYIHGNTTGDMIRGVALNSARTAILDSYIASFQSLFYDTQAIGSWNGPGPFKIVNNYLESVGENILFGGADPRIANLVPSDIEFRRNLCAKPLSWNPLDPSFLGVWWPVKNLFELKNAQRLLIDGNIFENNWVSAQNGSAIVFTPRNQDGTAPWSRVQDVTFTNNIVRHTSTGILLLGWDNLQSAQQTRRVRIQNNLFDDIGGPRWGGNGIPFVIVDGTADIRFDHNTAFQRGNILIADGRSHTGFTYSNNLTPHNDYGIVGSGTGTGTPSLAAYFPGYVCARNVFVGGSAANYPSNNFFPAALANVGFVDLAGGNYRLASGSPYKAGGSDGKDIGADIDAIEAAISGGTTTPPPPPPPPPPSQGTDIVLYASEAPVKAGAWQVVSDAAAAGGARLWNPDAGAPKLGNPSATPSSYFEITFNAQAGLPYRLWVRSKADNNSPYNDSFFVQFSGSVTSASTPIYRIGTTDGTVINLEDCSGCGLSGWGWQDNGWGVGVMGQLIYFQSTDTQTLRIQAREDGFSIDQIVLSPQSYLSQAPGALRNDTTILPETGQPPAPAPAPVVSSVTPNSGITAGGTSLTISGNSFVSGATVTLGGAAATNVNVLNGTTITATTPAHAAGAVNLVVSNPDNQSATLSNGFTYTTPAPPPETVLLADDFNDNSLNSSKWSANHLFSGYTNSSVLLNERNQRFEIGALKQNTGGSHYNGIRSATTYNFTNAYAYVELVQGPASATAADAMLTIGRDANNYYRIYVEAGRLICQKKLNGTKADVLNTPYQAVNHRFLRIRHDTLTGNVIFDTAPANAGLPGLWTQGVSLGWDTSAVPLTSVMFELKAGTWQAEATAPGTVLFDNFKVARP
jgi:hypothetical protein